MDIQETIQRLRAAKRAHLAWVGRAGLLVQGIAVSREEIPVLHTDCPFGRWYHGDGQALAPLPAFRAINAPHQALHEAYAAIFKLLFQEQNVSLFQRLLGKPRRAQAEAQAGVDAQMRRLEAASREVVSLLELLEQALLEHFRRTAAMT